MLVLTSFNSLAVAATSSRRTSCWTADADSRFAILVLRCVTLTPTPSLFSLSSGCSKRWIDPAWPGSVEDKGRSKASTSQPTAGSQSESHVEVAAEVTTAQKNAKVDSSRAVPMKPPLLRNYSTHVVTRWCGNTLRA